MADLHMVAFTGRLTRDPELRHTPGGTAILNIRLAYSSNRKDDAGAWVEKANYIDLVMFGNRGEAVSKHLSKGKQIGVTGKLEWREWEAQDGTKRQSYEVIVDEFQFLGGDRAGGGGGGSGERFEPAAASSGAESRYDPAAAATGGVDDDIPF